MELYPYLVSLGMPEGLTGDQPAKWLHVRELKHAAEIERLRRKLLAIRRWTDLSDETPPIQALVEIERLCKEAAEAKERDG